MAHLHRPLVLFAIAALVAVVPVVSAATPPSAQVTVSADLSQCMSTSKQQAAHIAEVEKELDRDRAMVTDLQRQITALRNQGSARPADLVASGSASVPPGPGSEADALNAQGAQLFARGDAEGAAPLFRRAAQAGHLGAMVNLALLYLNGRGLPQDPRQAVALLERASAQGSVSASENLGSMYQFTLGVSFNRDHAIASYQKAQAQGSSIAADHIAALRALPQRQ